ncbi:hypothetical protein [Williamsia sp.]|uniref:hypothetical protein n=1 Tax=Williamsia sp. TaxID=1872085 RepID=UPI002F92E9AD
MNDSSWAAVGVGILVLAVVLGVGLYVWYRQAESGRLDKDVDLALKLRSVAGDDPVRGAAIDEFETAIYERLFYVSTVGPRARGAAWALLGTVLSAFAALWVTGDGIVERAVHYGFAAVAVGFALTFVIFLALTVYAATTMPRISFADSYETEPSDR